MAKRLVKISKELNVGTTTIVDYLNNNGFDIENKPTSKVSDEMYDELLKEFQKSIAIKEQADQLVIGTRPATKEKEPVKKIFDTPTPTPVEKVEEVVIKQESVAKEEPKEVVENLVNRPVIGLKVKGKIDLDKKPTPKAKKVEKAPKPEVEEPKPKTVQEPKAVEKPEVIEEPKAVEKPEVIEEPKAVEKPTPVKKSKVKESAPDSVTEPKKEEVKAESSEDKSEEPKAKAEDGMIRAKTPTLKGLKIVGKIDTDQFKKPKKKKKDTKQDGRQAPSDKPGEKKTEVDDNKRRRRRRKKVVTTVGQGTNNNPQRSGGGGPGQRGNRPAGNSNRTGNNNRGGNSNRGGRGRRDEVKEVSKKEIEEKIKETMARLGGGKGRKRQKIRRENRERLRENQEQREQANEITSLQLTEFVSVSELASLMDVSVTQVITTCMNLGVIVSINQRLDAEIIELLGSEFGHEIEFITAEEQIDEEEEIIDDPADLLPRAPIVTVMGHVDHGKTSLLDYVREASVADGEAGGITQHIGAYEVLVGEDKKKITFLDTPGHEAFTAMRARGAKVTDIAIIIISADDSIMPQTKEAISHAQAANVPMVFAINKIDKDGADPERIKGELAGMNLQVEDWGGKYQSQDISAKMGTGIDELLEKILLEAELLELKANPQRAAVGTVVEASLDKGKGFVTKILVQTGTLKIGDSVVSGEHSGKVKAMFNEKGQRVKIAGPSNPVLILGLSGAPQAGEKFKVMESEQEARQIASNRAQINREQANRASKRISLDEIGRRLALGSFKELNLIVKGDVDGSIEALADSLIKQSIESVQVNVIHKAVGQIIESDVLLASASDAIVIGFQVRPSAGARKLAEKEGVQIKTYSIIYEVIDEIKSAIEGMLEPTKEEKMLAQVEVRDVFKISKVGTIAGCYVTEGTIKRNSHVRLIREGIVVYPVKEGKHGEISSLKRFKDDAKEVKFGMECGISIKNFNDIKVGDVIEGYEIVEIKQKLK
ncbi:translation initiation factor IF-2 [Saprospiraceae bacterium]|nr:translation initiation factor IF-2 [Saprospiraceae bacterium]